jgi:CheY-like chemotaxis protein
VAEGLLLPYKMQIDLRNSGRDAIEAVKAARYDLIFMDHKMPDMDGVEATGHIRALGAEDPYYKKVPIVILTANAVSGTKEMFLKSGFDDFLSKPIDTIKLNSVLEKWIPKEKKKKVNMEDVMTEMRKEDDVNLQVAIAGIDVKRGIFLSGGTLSLYLETLAIFCRDGLKKVKDLMYCIETGDLQLYTVHVHALKSAAANIGANGLSAAAKELETAGTREDLAYIEAHNVKFINDLESLLNIISNALSEYKRTNDAGITEVNKETLKSDLLKLKTALEDLDAGTINNTIDNLRNSGYPNKISIALEYISEKILIGEYEEAVELIQALLKEVSNGAS